MATTRSAREVKKPKAPVRRTIKREEREAFFHEMIVNGLGIMAACEKTGIQHKTGKKWKDEYEASNGVAIDALRIKGPKATDQMTPAARDALKDFTLFQERYLGRVPLPWQKTAAEYVAKLEASPEREYVVCNACPGSGKSTTFTHDIALWLICRNRGIRICILSSTQKNAEKFADRIRRTLEATVPLRAPANELAAGLSKDAKTTLAKDFGRFKPEEATTWTKERFRVDRPEDQEDHKENTVEAFGVKQSFLGGRYDLVLLDDVYDPSQNKTMEKKDEIKAWFTDQAESRLEPGGLFFLVMQRVGADDLSRHALDLEAVDVEDDDTIDEEERNKILAENERLGVEPLPIRDGKRRQYRHLVYKAHFDEDCKGPGAHTVKAPAWPNGCLLYPRRLTYRFLKSKEAQDPAKYRTWYQQEDIAPGTMLVQPEWISGEVDEYGIKHPGCWDKQRGAREMPLNITNNFHSFITVDPSPSQFWAVEWWLYHVPSKELFLMDLVRQRMTSPEFFDHPPQGSASGVLVDMYESSRNIGAPITHLIPEVNVAQRFMYQNSAIVDFLRSRSIALMPHTTTAQNKDSTEFGIQTLQGWFREGRIRLPGKQQDYLNSRTRSLKLVDEAEHYSLDGNQSRTTDCVLACWFSVLAVDKLYRPKKSMPTRNAQRPSWVGRPNLGVISA